MKESFLTIFLIALTFQFSIQIAQELKNTMKHECLRGRWDTLVNLATGQRIQKAGRCKVVDSTSSYPNVALVVGLGGGYCLCFMNIAADNLVRLGRFSLKNVYSF